VKAALAGQRVVVVGGGSGIGLAVAEAAIALDAAVTIMDVSRENLERARQTAPRADLVVTDVRSEASVLGAFAELTTIDHVYVAAGTTKLGSILDGPVDEQLASLVLRLWGSVFVTRAAAKKVRAGGSLTFTGGVSTDRPVAGAWVASVATAAAEQLARSMALELAPVRFNAVAPGWTDTPMWDAVLGPNKAEVFASVAAKLPTRRLSSPREVADAVLFLMQNEAITAEVLHVDGGGRLV
jgi:NAD(P)-dependent dehydrogenase (short-subunit alcohol dehydrogenase family)